MLCAAWRAHCNTGATEQTSTTSLVLRPGWQLVVGCSVCRGRSRVESWRPSHSAAGVHSPSPPARPPFTLAGAIPSQYGRRAAPPRARPVGMGSLLSRQQSSSRQTGWFFVRRCFSPSWHPTYKGLSCPPGAHRLITTSMWAPLASCRRAPLQAAAAAAAPTARPPATRQLTERALSSRKLCRAAPRRPLQGRRLQWRLPVSRQAGASRQRPWTSALSPSTPSSNSRRRRRPLLPPPPAPPWSEAAGGCRRGIHPLPPAGRPRSGARAAPSRAALWAPWGSLDTAQSRALRGQRRSEPQPGVEPLQRSRGRRVGKYISGRKSHNGRACAAGGGTGTARLARAQQPPTPAALRTPGPVRRRGPARAPVTPRPSRTSARRRARCPLR